jgi:general stress protein 26
MKQLRKPICIIIPILLLFSLKSFGQDTDHKEVSDDQLINAAKEIMTAAGTCALITLDEKNIPMVRVMDPFLPENDFTVWLGTNPKSRKVRQIKNNPNVTLYYLDKDASGYVVLHGKARLVDDQKEKDDHWKVEWEAFYPNRTEDYLLIKVSPESIEVISYPRGILGDTITWAAPIKLFEPKQ